MNWSVVFENDVPASACWRHGEFGERTIAMFAHLSDEDAEAVIVLSETPAWRVRVVWNKHSGFLIRNEKHCRSDTLPLAWRVHSTEVLEPRILTT